ncbi:hypothetical protein [Alicyclobacillus shizuokensis]|uniref:hypothetical protein n=1 Tax=Alicyclobacillus shizuokensis TaxID=392014 RepID=UPI000835137B|nr:hypothetical protein [Alicyclobacillus shizuokensis]
MSARANAKPALALGRFVHALFEHYHDKGMPMRTAKARMYDESLDTIYKFLKQEQDIPDHALVIAMQFASRALNHRGVALTKQFQNVTDEKALESARTLLRQIKAAKDAVDEFISSYKGVEGHDEGSNG